MKKKCLYYANDVLANSLLIIVFVWFSLSLSAQKNSFVYIENGNMYYECNEFYPMTCNYRVSIFKTQSDGFHISPAPSYCSDNPVNNCLPWVNCGDSVAAWKDKIEQHLLKIADLNFNSIRINGLQLQVDSSITGLYSRTYYDEIDHPCYDTVKDGFAVENDSTYKIIGDLMQDIVDIVKNNDTLKALKLIFTLGEDKNEIFQDEYADYLDYISDRFKHETQILGYDLFNEPFFNDDISSDTLSKYERAQIFYHWYRTIKNNAPAHLVTIGSKLHGVINWDAQVLPCDFISFHVYSLTSAGDNYDFNAAYERYKVKLKWIYESFDLPLYIMGETGLPGIDSVENLYPGVPSESEQLEFAKRSLTHVPWMGMKGYSWWVYKDTKEWPDTISGANQNYFGLIRRGMPGYGEVNKPVAEEFENFTHVYQFDTCTYPNDDLYHHPNPENYTNNVLSGIVTTPDSTPLRNVFIMVSQYEPISDSSRFYETSFAITDSTGQFEIMSGLDSCHVEQIRASFPGMTAIDTTKWGIGFQSPLHLIIDNLEPDSLPQPVVHNNTLIIAGTDTISWDSLMVVNASYIRVDSGALLTVTDTAWMKPGAKIVVMPGGRMVVDGGMLTGFCTWEGIEVWGNSDATQIPANQGWLSISNGGTIENAEVALRVGSEDFINKGGGIVSATEAVFRNNLTGVLYHNYAGSNIGNFNLSIFETTAELVDSSTPEDLMKLISVENIKINGCTFRNTCDSTVAYSSRGKGITALDASFYLDHICISETTPCTAYQETVFDSLYYGVYAYNISSAIVPSIRNSQFTKNFRGAYLSGTTRAVVDSCSFETNAPFAVNGGYGLYLDNCTGYTIAENNFYSTMDSPTSIGMIVHNSGTDPNEVYRNWFSNLDQGISAQEQNRDPRSILGQGLQIRCCTFDTCNFDILIPQPALAGRGIALHQGANSDTAIDMAGNLFDIHSQTPNNDYDDINNQGLHMIYYYPENTNNDAVEPIDYTHNSITLVGRQVNPSWSLLSGCPETIESGSGSEENELMARLAEANQDINNIEQILATLVDGGDTDVLYQEVESSFPPEVMEVYNELIEASPYLSDTVVGAAIEKEEVMPGAMLRDVMVANPQSAKSEKLMAKLDDRYTPLSEYMKAQILQGRNVVSMKESLESQLAKYRLQKLKAFNRLIHHYMHNDTITDWRDSISNLLTSDNELRSKYELALWQLQNGEPEQSGNTLSSIPTTFDLQGTDLAAYNDMFTLHNILAGIISPDSGWLNVTPSKVQQLVNLSQTTSPASVYARNILIASGNLVYDEPIQLPNLMKSTKAGQELQNILNTKKPAVLELFPNPADDYFVLSYQFKGETTGASIKIRNTRGELIKTILVSQAKEQHIVNTETWLPGIYIAALMLNGDILDSIKLTLVK